MRPHEIERFDDITRADLNFLFAVAAELKRARDKFPSAHRSFAALVEEVGELATAHLEGAPQSNIHAEAVQVAVMALRVAVEHDTALRID